MECQVKFWSLQDIFGISQQSLQSPQADRKLIMKDITDSGTCAATSDTVLAAQQLQLRFWLIIIINK